MQKTQGVALTALMASLALSFSMLKLELPYPVLPYLKFDLAEIPVTILYFLAGLRWGLAAETLHLLGLLARGAEPVGALLKYSAVISMLIGARLFRKIMKSITLEFAGGAVTRIFAMSFANWAYFTFLFPNFLDYAVKMAGGVYLLYVYTAVFNLIHTLVSMGISWLVFKEIKVRLRVPA
ncbi:MAG: hypothetical protein ACP5II_03370 [Infirmifilum sp.]|jgi:riboflavin transporter FmnP|uniref:ECF transporter S component n=1 Tax=Infirmifilum TaxID=2856573 RepID=UPI002356704B